MVAFVEFYRILKQVGQGRLQSPNLQIEFNILVSVFKSRNDIFPVLNMIQNTTSYKQTVLKTTGSTFDRFCKKHLYTANNIVDLSRYQNKE